MTRWRKRLADKYTVKITYTKTGRAQITVPAPIIRLLYQPDKITFKVGDQEVIAKFEKTTKSDSTNA